MHTSEYLNVRYHGDIREKILVDFSISNTKLKQRHTRN